MTQVAVGAAAIAATSPVQAAARARKPASGSIRSAKFEAPDAELLELALQLQPAQERIVAAQTALEAAEWSAAEARLPELKEHLDRATSAREAIERSMLSTSPSSFAGLAAMLRVAQLDLVGEDEHGKPVPPETFAETLLAFAIRECEQLAREELASVAA